MREFDIRPAEFLREYNRLSAEDADTFFPERDKLVLRLCPACGNEKTSNPFEKNRFLIARCDNCGTQYVTSLEPGFLSGGGRKSAGENFQAPGHQNS